MVGDLYSKNSASHVMRNPLQQVYASHTLRAPCGDVELLPSVSLNRNG